MAEKKKILFTCPNHGSAFAHVDPDLTLNCVICGEELQKQEISEGTQVMVIPGILSLNKFLGEPDD